MRREQRTTADTYGITRLYPASEGSRQWHVRIFYKTGAPPFVKSFKDIDYGGSDILSLEAARVYKKEIAKLLIKEGVISSFDTIHKRVKKRTTSSSSITGISFMLLPGSIDTIYIISQIFVENRSQSKVFYFKRSRDLYTAFKHAVEWRIQKEKEYYGISKIDIKKVKEMLDSSIESYKEKFPSLLNEMYKITK